jgi:tetratricopeptide (TPR) repeat protein
MRSSTSDHPKVFISYSHDSHEHMDRVLALANRLRADGIDCHIDQYEDSPSEGWPRWMVNQIEDADFVLLVCTENYERRFRGREETGKGLGVKWEGAIITQEIYEAEAHNTMFIPVLFSSHDSANIPIVLRGATRYELKTAEGYDTLYRRLTNQPLTQKPELGKIRPMPPRERKQSMILESAWFESQSTQESPIPNTEVVASAEDPERIPSSQNVGSTPEASLYAPKGRIRGTTTAHRSRILWKKPLVLGTGVVLLILLGAALLASWLWRTGPADTSALTSAYQALERGEWTQAEALFRPLTERPAKRVQSQGYAGLAALALVRGSYQQALDLAGRAEALDPEIAYTHVIRGYLLLQQGKVTEATLEYRTATEKAHGVPWQQASAHNQLGRVYAVQGDAQKALEHYDRAIGQDQQLAVAYANKGYLLEKLGKPQEALVLYRRALQHNPDDRLTETLLREGERREKLARDKQTQERIDLLVSDLVRTYQEGKRREIPGDGWTSTPLTLALLDVQTQGTLASRAGEEEFLFLRMVEGLRASGRLEIVERATLDKLLEELKLSASDLTDPQVAVRVGRILAARLIAIGSFTRFGEEGRLGIRVIETETTRIKASAVEPVAPPRGLDAVVDRVSKALLQQLREAYPLQGRIAQVTPPDIIVNIGGEQGATPGLTLQVFGPEEPLEYDGKSVSFRGLPIGLIEMTNVEATLSQARVLEQTIPFQSGWKVKEVQRR